MRVTPQRVAVYRTLAEDTSHAAAEAVYARLRPVMPSLSLATVYRILESLEKEGLIRRVSTTYGVGRFDANLAAHQHLFCRHCGGLTDVQVESLAALELPETETEGFEAGELDICIIGTCGKCRPVGDRKQKMSAKDKARKKQPGS